MKKYPEYKGGLTSALPVVKYHTDGRYPTPVETWFPFINQSAEPSPKLKLVFEILTPSEIEQKK